MPTPPPELIVPDAAAWRQWLTQHCTASSGVTLVLAKKGTTSPTSLDHDAALEEALCFGWIDGQVSRRDDATFRQRFTPRRARSPWSKRNVGIVERLIAEGRMQPTGVAEIERARADGRWDTAYPGQAAAEVPDDLAAALAHDDDARTMFDQLSSQNRYAVLFRIGQAKRPETRARRIEQFVAMLARGETIHPQNVSSARRPRRPGPADPPSRRPR